METKILQEVTIIPNNHCLCVCCIIQTYYGLQAAQDGSIDQHLADLHIDGQAGQVLSQRGEDMITGVTCTDLPQQTDSVTDRLRLRRIHRPAQKVLWRPVLTFLPGRQVEWGNTLLTDRIKCSFCLLCAYLLYITPWYEGKAPPVGPEVSQGWSNPWRRQTCEKQNARKKHLSSFSTFLMSNEKWLYPLCPSFLHCDNNLQTCIWGKV